MANWSNPLLTSTYTNFVTEVKDRDTDLALQFDGTTSTNIPTGTIRWNSTANRWQKWSGAAWGELTTTYALTGLSTTGNASIGGTLGVTGTTTLGAATATTVATADNSTNIATTAFVKAQGYAGLLSPAFTGTPTAPTAAVSNNSTQLATTAYVSSQIANDALLLAGGTMSGALVGIAGTATAPGLQVGVGTTYKPGIYSPGTDQLAISTGGSGRLFVDAGGNVGIGGLPQNDASYGGFTVNGLNGSIITLRAGGLNSGRIYTTGTDNINIDANGTASTNILFRTGTSSIERARIDYSGRLGIGTTPVNVLDVVTASYLDTVPVKFTRGGAGGSSGYLYADGSGAGIYSGAAFANAGIYLVSNDRINFNVNGSERLRITSAGLVGVGNSSPSSYNASSNDLVVGNHTGAHGVTICSQNNSSGYIMFADGTTGAQTYAGQITYDHTNNRLTLGTNDGTTGLTIDSLQRVGIGTSSPSEALTVNGRVQCQWNAFANGGTTSYSGDATSLVTGSTAGMWAARSDSALLFSIGSSEKARIDSSGRLGIGTTPSTLLHMAGGNFRVDGSTSANKAVFQVTPGASTSAGADITVSYDGAGSYGPLTFTTGGSEAARIDSSRRLLVGTSSYSDNAIFVAQGNTSDGLAGAIDIRRGDSSPASGSLIGTIRFRDGSAGTLYGLISCEADAATGVADKPGRLVFSTTADGASSPTERMRISNAGALGFSGANYGSSGQSLISQGSSAAPAWGSSIVSGNVISYIAATGGGTIIDFSGIPSWVKRITVIFVGLSTNGTSGINVQIGTGGVLTTTGYTSTGNFTNQGNGAGGSNSTTGFNISVGASATGTVSGTMTIVNLLSSNTWISSHAAKALTSSACFGGGDVTLSNTLNILRVTTTNGTDVFDAGSVSIQYE